MRWIPAIGGLFATAAAIVVLASQIAPRPVDSITIEPTVPQPEASTEVVELSQEPDLGVPDLATSVADVLEQDGYTQFVGEPQLSENLPDDVVQVLINNEAVLVIAEEGDK